MNAQVVLTVDDNPVTRKMLRVALECEGYRVHEAGDARAALRKFDEERPDLVLQDIVLPDLNGFDLVRKLRALPRGADVPILAITGLVSRAEQARLSAAAFDEILIKPIEPSRLIPIVRRFLPDHRASLSAKRNLLILVVDDDPVQKKLARLRLLERGFQVSVASNGAEALIEAKKNPPDAILSDVMMPVMDGFQLCRSVREDPSLRETPVVLMSSQYLEGEDRELARGAGACTLVERDPMLEKPLDALARAIGSRFAPEPIWEAGDLDREHLHRLMSQLERQSALSAGYAQRCTIQSAALTVIRGFCELIARQDDIHAALDEVLHAIIDISSASCGALYLKEPNGVRLVSRLDGASTELAEFFGSFELVTETVENGEPFVLDRSRPDSARALGKCHAASGVLVPLVAHGRGLGAMFLAFGGKETLDEDRLSLVQTAGVQVGQALGLQRAFARATKIERRYRSLLENTTDGILVLSPRGRVLEANKRAEELHARPRSEILGRSLAELVATDSRAADELLRFETILQKGAVRADDVPIVRGDGKPGFADFSAILVNLGDEELVIAMEHDTTERRRLEEQLRQSQKMEAIGRLTGGIAHDFNNILAIVLSSAEFLDQELAPQDPRREDVTHIKSAAQRAAALTRQLLAFSRKQVLELKNVDVDAVAHGLEPLLRRIIGEDIVLSIERRGEVAVVRADPGQLEQVIMNLVVNARDAMPSGGNLLIETSHVDLAESYADGHVTSVPGRYVMLAVTDTGCGMSRATQQHVFEPFFTTKEPGKGTGLGLSTCYGIVKQVGGHIVVYSEPEHGTAIKIYLPMVDGLAEPKTEKPAPKKLAGSETVLLIEDDAGVRSVARRILAHKGYLVLVASGAAEASSVAQERAEPIDLVVSDVVMLGSNGPDVASKVRESHPEAKVLFMSGYTEHAVFTTHGIDPGSAFLQKPFTPDALARKVRELLDA